MRDAKELYGWITRWRYLLIERLENVQNSPENERLPNGDWYDTIYEAKQDMIEELCDWRYRNAALDKLLDDVVTDDWHVLATWSLERWLMERTKVEIDD